MKIAILTNAIHGSLPEYVAMTDVLKSMYCKQQGIDYVRMASNPHPNNRPHWSKPKCILDILNSYDWVVWMDADAAPVNMTFNLSKYLLGIGDHVIMLKDVNGWNSGVFALPSTERGFKWIGYIDSLHDEKKYQDGYVDQQAMADSFDLDEWKDYVLEPSSEIGWNSYLNIYKGETPNKILPNDWVLHLPGVGDKTRNLVFRTALMTILERRFMKDYCDGVGLKTLSDVLPHALD